MFEFGRRFEKKTLDEFKEMKENCDVVWIKEFEEMDEWI